MKPGAILFSLCGIVLMPLFARAQCVEFEDPAELFRLSDAVFVGTVVATEPTGAQGSHVIVSIATLRPERTWKGRPGREVRVGSDVPFEVGKKYVVFAAGRPLSVSILCRWAENIDRAKRKLDWLARRRSQAAG
jgi:hypothetical protein